MIKLYDVVALIEDIPDENLLRGQVGTAIEQWEKDVFEVEFSDHEGRTYAMLPLRTDQLIVLHYEPVEAS